VVAEEPRTVSEIPESVETIHIIGICGTAMGSLAAMLQQRGYIVRGSDAMAYPPMSTFLEERDIDIMSGYDESNLDWDPDLVVVGNVCRAEYGDAVAMREHGYPHLSFPEALRYFFFDSQRPLVVTGTHGKTTTTSMLAWILHDAGLDPSFFAGGVTGNFDSNYRLGDGACFVIEGDEYDTAYFDKVPKFWHYAPFRATINNIEYDHADIYDEIETIERMFRQFAELVPEEGSLWVNGDDERALFTVTEHGFGKRTRLSEYRTQSRYGMGLIDIKTDERNGRVSTAKAVTDDDHLVIMSQRGQIMRIRAGDISEVGRNTKGVTIMELADGDAVATVTVVPASSEDAG